MQQLDITKGDQIKSKQTLQKKPSISICVILVELTDDWRIATSSRLLHIIPLSRLLFVSFTVVNRSSKSEWNIYLSMPPHFKVSLENLIINISLIFIYNVTKIFLCKSCSFEMIAIWKMFQYFYLFRKRGNEFMSRTKLGESGYNVEIFSL